MPIIGTYNGLSIVQMPSTPGFKEINLKKHTSVAVLSSPFTGQMQTQTWPGADWWSADITLPQMNQTNAKAWSAFFSSCRGMLNVFPWGHSLFARPQGNGTYGTLPVVNGVNAPMTTTLSTRGWKPNTRFLLMPGDLIQIGTVPANANAPGLCRLHEVVDRVDADGSGIANISVWPSLREATFDGQALMLGKPKGLFRLATNDTSALSTMTRLSGVSFQIIEAR